MGWVYSFKAFCSFSKILTNMANFILQTSLTVPRYSDIANIPKIGTTPSHTLDILTHIYFYMDDIIAVVQGRPERQRNVFNVTGRALKWLLPYFTNDAKDLENTNTMLS